MTKSRSRRRAACNAVRNATWSATLHRTCLRHIPISHRSRVTRHLPADIGHGNGWILLSDSDQSEESNGWILLSDSDQSEQSSRHATRSAERGVSASSISRPRMPFRPVSSNQSRHVIRAHRRFTALVYATFRSLQPPPPRMTSSFASDAPPTGRHRASGLSDSDQSELSSHARYRWYKRHCAFVSPHFLL